MKTKTTTVYVAMDGTEFKTKKECAEYEKKIEKQKIFVVLHRPDLTEGRGSQEATVFIAPPAGYNGNYVDLYFEDFCYRQFGRKIAFVQGVQAIRAWSFFEITPDRLPYFFQFGTLTPKKAPVVKLAVGDREEGYVMAEGGNP